MSLPSTHIRTCRIGVSGTRENSGTSSRAFLRQGAELYFGWCRGQGRVHKPDSDGSRAMRGFEEVNAEYQAVLGLLGLGCLHLHLTGCCTCSQLSSPLRGWWSRRHTPEATQPVCSLPPRGSCIIPEEAGKMFSHPPRCPQVAKWENQMVGLTACRADNCYHLALRGKQRGE